MVQTPEQKGRRQATSRRFTIQASPNEDQDAPSSNKRLSSLSDMDYMDPDAYFASDGDSSAAEEESDDVDDVADVVVTKPPSPTPRSLSFSLSPLSRPVRTVPTHTLQNDVKVQEHGSSSFSEENEADIDISFSDADDDISMIAPPTPSPEQIAVVKVWKS